MAHPEPVTRSRLTRDQVDILLRHVMRLPELFAAAKDRLSWMHFDMSTEFYHRFAWDGCLLAVNTYLQGRLPSERTLTWIMTETAVRAKLAEDKERYPDSLADEICGQQGFLEFIFGGPDEAMHPDWGRRLLAEFLEERDVSDRLRAVILSTEDRPVTNLPEVLDGFSRAHSDAHLVEGDPIYTPAVEEGVLDDIELESTGIEFLDQILGGGDGPGKVYGVLGAYASGKTTLCAQMAFAKAKVLQQKVEGTDTLPEEVFLFHYEANKQEITRRLWSHAACIHGDSLRHFRWVNLSQRGHLKNYELDEFKEEIKVFGMANVDGELERLKKADLVIRKNLRVIDCSGPADNPARGSGYVNEIAAILHDGVARGRKIGSVLIDYAGLACRRYLTAKGRRREDLRHLIGEFGDECRRQIADVFLCPVWIFHQLSGASNARAFAAKHSHADAAECKSFAENLWHCLELGVKNPEHNLVQLQCSKARDSAGIPHPILLRHKGGFYTLEVATDMTVDLAEGTPITVASKHIQGEPGMNSGFYDGQMSDLTTMPED